MEDYMKLNKKVIDSITVCGLCAMLTVTAVTNSAEDKVLANTGLEHTGYNSYAGVAATLFDYEKGLTAENAVTVEKENVEMVAAAQDAQQEAQPQLTQEQQEWQTKLMPKVEESLNVRAQADEQSDIVGKLYKGSVADIVENDGTWAHIKSGNVDGYVNVSYCVTGTDALSYAYDTCGEIATVNTDGLRVRETADTNSKALEVADQGKTYQVDRAAQAPDGWIAVVSDSQTGYIAADYATRSLNTRVGITIEEEQAQIAAQKEAERKAAEEKAAAEAAKAAKKNTSSKKAETTQGEAVSAGADDLTLLAAIIECEAGGESYECQLAVINRVKSSSYPNSISGVIYQKGQFGPASSGKLARKLSGRISSSCYSAAQEAMSGVDNTGGCTSFNDHGSGISIGNMKFR
jgi:spore germination cell wall hydrolase CwlJ-like protein